MVHLLWVPGFQVLLSWHSFPEQAPFPKAKGSRRSPDPEEAGYPYSVGRSHKQRAPISFPSFLSEGTERSPQWKPPRIPNIFPSTDHPFPRPSRPTSHEDLPPHLSSPEERL